MTTDDEFDRQIQAYLEFGPAELTDRVLWAARAQLKTTRRRRPGFAWLAPWRNTQMTQNTRLLLVGGGALAIVLAIGAGFFGSIFARPNPGPAASAAQSAPGFSATPSAPSSSVAPGPSASIVSARAPGWSATGGMTKPRGGQTATLLSDGKVLVAGGWIGPDRNGEATSAELYDPSSGTWSVTGSMHEGRNGQTATLLQDGRVLVAGGCCAVSSAPQTAELYDPVSGTWTFTAEKLLGGEGRTATLLPDGKVLVVGGNYGPQRAVLYDPISGTGTVTGGELVTNRYYATATLLSDGRLLVAGGQLGRRTRDASAELYDPSSGSWTATGNMKARRTDHAATLLTDGRVLVAGGLSADRDEKGLVSAELYDPISGSWTATGNMVTARGGGYSLTVLPDGKVLVAGGFRSDRTGALASAELYDPGTGTWTAARNMDTPRAGHTATLLPDGRVLVSGGVSSDRKPLASAELYDPGVGN